MPRRRALRTLLCIGYLGAAAPSAPDHAGASGAPADPSPPGDAAAIEDLRERLTEREDQRRPEEPRSVELFGHPLVLSGQLGVSLDFARWLGDTQGQSDRLMLEHELEAFYSLGEPLSLFAQLRLGSELDLGGGSREDLSELFVERGEMWLYSEDILGSGLSFDVGRLDFEDDRRWWWDDELDAVRLGYEWGDGEVVLAIARELAPRRSDRGDVDPEQERVLRLIGEASWDWRDDHGLDVFALYQRDRSPTEDPGQIVDREREDDTDADLLWLGLRAMGAWQSPRRGILGYWLDAALVTGDETLVAYEDVSRGASRVEAVHRQGTVRGWAADLGVTWILPLAAAPRLTLGYAIGSGDRSSENDADRSFHQTGIQANEAGFGGVQRFNHYGLLLEPELSNLHVVTAGAGLSLFEASSLDLVYHHYRLLEPAVELREARFDVSLTGDHRDLGDALDLVLAVEEWSAFEIEVRGALFRAGRAFGRGDGDWDYGSFVQLTVNF